MNRGRGRLVLLGLLHYRRTHVGVLLGAACTAAILTGALLVGASLRTSLRQAAKARIGKVDCVLTNPERYFRADLADRLRGASLAPVLLLPGLAKTTNNTQTPQTGVQQAGAQRTGMVQVLGVDQRFFALTQAHGAKAQPAPGHAHVSRSLAQQLDLRLGQELLLRVEQPSVVPRDLALSTIDDIATPLRVKIDSILADDGGGTFALTQQTQPAANVVVALAWLQQELELTARANLLLAAPADGNTRDLATRLNRELADCFELDDVQLSVRQLADSPQFELGSSSVFLPRAVELAAVRAQPGLVGILTYFVNSISTPGDGSTTATPYSMVAGIGALSGEVTDPSLQALLAALPADLGQDAVVANEWLAQDLGLRPGATVQLDYQVIGAGQALVERTASSRLAAIVPLRGATADRTLMPAFPGLNNAENCRDWDLGVPIDMRRVRQKDEKYWQDHRGTPKLFLPLPLAQRLFENRHGRLTAIRGAKAKADEFAKRLRQALEPTQLGLRFENLRRQALAATDPATDFGGLFLGLSLFLIVAALLLLSLQFAFGVGQRQHEIGMLLAIGFRPQHVLSQFLLEGLVLASIGSGLGAIAGILYTAALLTGLATIWRGAAPATAISLHVDPWTLLIGVASSVAASMLAIWIAGRSGLRQTVPQLLGSEPGLEVSSNPLRPGRMDRIVACLCAGLACSLPFTIPSDGRGQALRFFLAGGLLLTAMLLLVRHRLRSPRARRPLPSLTALARHNTRARPARSLAVVALLACSTFLSLAIQANRVPVPSDPSARDSGTGGFSLWAESRLPVLRDPRSPAGRELFQLDSEDLADVAIVPLRLRQGDDSSCHNLGQPQQPALLGVDPARLIERGAFRFAHVAKDLAATAIGWDLLDVDLGPDVVPAIGDAESVTWVLHRKLGDEIEYTAADGRPVRLRLVATLRDSILQGHLIIADRHLTGQFGVGGGYRKFLIDAPPANATAIAGRLEQALSDLGLVTTPTKQRLVAFLSVQNTYLSIFQVLGALGMLLGSIGLGLVVMRNSLERRRELALLLALGYSLQQARRLLVLEHAWLLVLGLGCGLCASSLALGGTLARSGTAQAWPYLLAAIITLVLCGLVSVVLAARIAIPRPGHFLAALRGA